VKNERIVSYQPLTVTLALSLVSHVVTLEVPLCIVSAERNVRFGRKHARRRSLHLPELHKTLCSYPASWPIHWRNLPGVQPCRSAAEWQSMGPKHRARRRYVLMDRWREQRRGCAGGLQADLVQSQIWREKKTRWGIQSCKFRTR